MAALGPLFALGLLIVLGPLFAVGPLFAMVPCCSIQQQAPSVQPRDLSVLVPRSQDTTITWLWSPFVSRCNTRWRRVRGGGM